MTPTALLRAAVAPLLATAIGVTAIGVTALWVTALSGTATAHAAPAPVAEAPGQAPGQAPQDDDTSARRPVRIDVGRFEPRAVTPGAAITVTGTLTNEGPSRVSGLNLRMQRGQVLTTRAQLSAVVRDTDPATAVEPAFAPLTGDLPPGGTLEFSYLVTPEELRLDQDGVYPVLLNVNGSVDGEQQRVGELSTFVVQQPVVPTARTAVAWLWPLVERTHRGPSGEFLDDELTTLVSADGRLDRALAVIERLPATTPPGSDRPVPALRVTLAIDPSLVEALAVMAAGPYSVAGEATAGRGTEAAGLFLKRLSTVADVHPVLALAYGDVDADSLYAAGLAGVLTRTLPGSSAGTAEDPPGRDSVVGPADPEEDGSATPSPSVDSGPADADTGTGAGAAILAAVLDVEPRTDLAWPADGALSAGALATLRAAGTTQVVLDADAFSSGTAATGSLGGLANATATVTATATATVAAPAGPVGALVADPVVAAVVGAAQQVPGGPRLAEQRYLAELALISMQAPAGSEPTVLVTAARDVQAALEGVGAMMADTAGLPWLRPATVAELSAAPATADGQLVPPAEAAGLDPAGMVDVVAAVGIRNDLAGAVVGDADTILSRQAAAIARTTSASWRSTPDAFRQAAATLRSALVSLRGRVTLLSPADGTYSLGSTDAPLVLTVNNDLPVAVQVRLQVNTRGTRALSVTDIGVQTLAPQQRMTLQVPTEVRQSGGFTVTAQLTTPNGAPLGDQIQLQVKSTAYGFVSLLITFGAAGLLGMLFLRRLVLFVLRRRRSAAGPRGDEQPEPDVAQPVDRSPV